MKKLFYIITAFITFITFDNIKAMTVNAYYDSDFVNRIVQNSDISDINNILIPYIEENFQDYIVYLGLNYYDSIPTIKFSIMTKNDNYIPSTRSYLRNGYSNGFDIGQPTSFNSEGVASGYFSAKCWERWFKKNSNYNDINDIISALDEFLANPNSFHYTESIITQMFPLPITVSNDSVDFLKTDTQTPRETLPYYSNYDLRILTSASIGSYNVDSYIVHFNNNTYNYHLIDFFPFYKDFVSLNTYLPPNSFDYGDGQFGYNSNQIIISDINNNAETTVKCPQNTDFVNDFCYTNRFSYHSTSDMPDSALNISFDLENLVPFRQSDYYVFTFRIHSQTNYLPVSASINSGNVSMPIQIVKTNIINNGIYKDVQLVLKATQSFGNNEPYSLNRISLIFPMIKTSEPTDYSEWYFGMYKTYKMSGVGNQTPTQQILDNDYHNNDIDSVGNNDNNTSWFNKFRVNDRGLSNIITAPITLFQNMRTASCSNIVLPLPHFGNITLPCISSILNENVPTVLNIYQIIISGIICYYVGLNYFRIIKNAFTPDNDRIEVQDL